MRLRPGKCMFAQKEIDYLGFTLTEKGIRPNNAKVKAVKEFPSQSQPKR